MSLDGTDPSAAAGAAVARRLVQVRRTIAEHGGDPDRVQIIGVTKGHGVDAVLAALGAGIADIGENYAQELRDKAATLAGVAEDGGPRPRWHFIGRLQTNKVRMLAPLVSVWHTVDRAELAAEIARRSPGAAVLVQVNVSDEPQKGGCEPDVAGAVVDHCRELGLRPIGLMTVGRTGAPALARPGFALLRRLGRELGLAELSMGMSDDYPEAVEEGATMLRLGTVLFGPRPVAASPPRVPLARPEGQ